MCAPLIRKFLSPIVVALRSGLPRWYANDRAVSDEISAADRDVAFDHHVRLHDRVVADCHIWPNDREWPDLHTLADFRFRIDDRCSMNLHIARLSSWSFVWRRVCRVAPPFPSERGRVRVDARRVRSNPSPSSSPLEQGERRLLRTIVTELLLL